MDWEILPYEGMGPIKFGMTPEQVAEILGEPESVSTDGDKRREFREDDVPIVSYRNDAVTEIEAFYDVENITLRGTQIFGQPRRRVLAFLERENGGAKEFVGTILFENIGISAGRLDQAVEEDHSVVAFGRGVFDALRDRFKPISFL